MSFFLSSRKCLSFGRKMFVDVIEKQALVYANTSICWHLCTNDDKLFCTRSRYYSSLNIPISSVFTRRKTYTSSVMIWAWHVSVAKQSTLQK